MKTKLPQAMYITPDMNIYPSNIIDFDGETGNATLQLNTFETTTPQRLSTQEILKDVPAVKIQSYPCGLDSVGAQGRNCVYCPTSDPRTWVVGITLTKNNDGTFDAAVPTSTGMVTIGNIPSLQPQPSSTPPFWLPNPFIMMNDEVSSWWETQ